MQDRPATRSRAPLSVGFISLGCAKNLVDSQVMADRLLAASLRLAPAPEAADVVIVNTCAFIADAREESLAMIRQACSWKRRGPCRAVLVAGCLPQRYRTRVRAALPEVDGFIGLDELDQVGDLVRQLGAGTRGVLTVSERATRLYEPGAAGVVFSGGPYAYLKLAEGCNHRCAFCAIPAIRGAYRSRPVAGILREAETLLARGFRELNLISQDTTAYGRDLGDGTSLAGLLRALGRLGGRFWVRVLYGYPAGVTRELLAAMAETPQVCHYLDIPIQHSHPDILRAMRRADTLRALRTLAERSRAVMPDVALRTTCLVGFPGETEEHVRHLIAHVAAVGFDHLGVFAYSPEEGTAGERLPNRPPARTATARRRRVLAAQQRVARRLGRARVHTRAEVLLDRPLPDAPGIWLARSMRQAPDVDGTTVVHGAGPQARAGDFLRVRYTAASAYDLEATVDA